MVIQYFPMYRSIMEQEKEQQIIWTHVSVRGLQLSSLITPPVFLVSRLLKNKPSYGKVAPLTTALSLGIAYYIAYGNLEHPKHTEKNQMIAFNLQRDRKLIFREDWTLLGMFAGLVFGLSMPVLAVHSSALTGSYLGFYFSWSIAELKARKALPDSLLKSLDITKTS